MLAIRDTYLHRRTWTGSRIVRLLMGLFFVAAGFGSGEPFVTFVGGMLALGAFLRIGCSEICNTDISPKN
jgi:hypothetical protein